MELFSIFVRILRNFPKMKDVPYIHEYITRPPSKWNRNGLFVQFTYGLLNPSPTFLVNAQLLFQHSQEFTCVLRLGQTDRPKKLRLGKFPNVVLQPLMELRNMIARNFNVASLSCKKEKLKKYGFFNFVGPID